MDLPSIPSEGREGNETEEKWKLKKEGGKKRK